MRQKSAAAREPAEQVMKNLRPGDTAAFSAEDKIRIVLDGLRGEDSIALHICGNRAVVEACRCR